LPSTRLLTLAAAAILVVACGDAAPTASPAAVTGGAVVATASTSVGPTTSAAPTASPATPAPVASTPEPVVEASPSPSSSAEPVDDPQPAPAWIVAHSKRFHYRMAYPEGWQIDLTSKGYLDSYFGIDGQTVFVDRFPANGNTLAQLSTELKRNPDRLTTFKSVKVLSNKAGRLGPYPARVALTTGKYRNKTYWWVTYFAVRGGRVYWLELRTEQKTTVADRALAAQFAKTFVAD
jgi:hypothetical protein